MNKKIFIHITLFIIAQILISMLMFIVFIPFVNADDNITLYPIADTYVASSIPDGNFGDGVVLTVSTLIGTNRRTFLKFGLSSIPEGATISLATLRGDCWTVLNLLDGVTDVQARRVADDSWTELGITWNNQPAYGNVEDTQIPSIAWIEWDVTGFVQNEWDNDKTVSICLRCVQESYDSTNRYSIYHSKEYNDDDAELYIEYTLIEDNKPYYSNPQDNGITQVGEDVTVSCFWEDDFELDTCYVEHNSTEAFTNYSISVSGSSSWANKTFQLNFMKNIKVAYRWFCSDNASQWNSTGYYYITTTQLYITFNLNNSTQGRFYVDYENTVNNTQNGYDYNQTVFLLGATYNASYVWCNFTYGETIITENFYEYQTDGNKTLWSYFDICNATGNGNGNYTENDLHEYFVLGAVISAVCGMLMIIIIDKKDLVRGK